MKYTLKPGNQSNYEIQIVCEDSDREQLANQVLADVQKDFTMQGFRPGHVPMDIIKKQVDDNYIQYHIIEKLVYQGTETVLKENESIKFIGQIYDVAPDLANDQLVINLKLDIYPEATESNSNWKAEKIGVIDDTISDKEVTDIIGNIQKQYAEYSETDTVTAETIGKFTFGFFDAEGNQIDKGTAFIGSEDIAEFPILSEIFVGKKEAEEVTIKYDHDTLPHILHLHKEGVNVDHIKGSMSGIKLVSLPEMTDENIIKWFGNDDITSKKALEDKIKEVYGTQKRQQVLGQAVESYVSLCEPSFEITIPQTMIAQEREARLKSLEERFGSKENVEKYIANMKEEDRTKFNEEINTAAVNSLKKFFVLMSITKGLGIENQINWQQQFDAEEKLYAYFNK